ncbi:glycosyltransferase family 4 protein [Myroides odoratimimus]|uniref:glycosyltransferase family 4 protein n=1 Tax=Myroides odoratimimus TaxID=76832 RepID=UPI002578AA36|nr:glycosyltransferase family 4 protein [Myroides odoratimimus]
MKLIRITTVPGSFGLLKGQLRFMCENGYNVIGVSSGGNRLERVSVEEGVRTIPIEMTRSITPFKDLIALFKLIKLFVKEKPQIVHTHTPKAGLLGMLAAKITGVPCRLHTVAGMPLTVTTGLKRYILVQIERLTYFCATKVYPNSYGLMDIILNENIIQKDKLKVIGKGSSNGIDCSVFDPITVNDEVRNGIRTELGILEDDFVFIFVGRLVRDKGVNELVKAFDNICKDYPKAHLLLVGGFERELDPLDSEIEEIIIENSNIHAVGFKNNVKNYFSIADVLTFPSYREGFPNVVMQAAAMQLNSIVSNINGCNEIIINGKNGWIIPVKDSLKLQEKMIWCLMNTSVSKQMGLRSREGVESNYDTKFIWNELLNEYKQNLNSVK